MDILTALEMKRADERAINELGIPGVVLMENAGRALAEAVQKRGNAKRVLILAGPGNNGGDGFVAARHLHVEKDVRVWLLVGREKYKGDARTNLEILLKLGICPREINDESLGLLEDIREADVIVDALFGTGLSRPLDGTAAWVVEKVNEAGKPVIAADIPSGICADSGKVLGRAIRAVETVTFARPKRGLYLFPGADYAGQVRVVDIGIPPRLLCGHGMKKITGEEVARRLPRRPRDAHKGTFGTVLLVGGSLGMPGAVALAARAALRTGAGKVVSAVPACVQPTVAALAAEATTVALSASPGGTISQDAVSRLREAWVNCSSLAVGPGLSTGEELLSLLAFLLEECPLSMVLDADGLNLLSRKPSLLPARKYPTVITPHPGEAARLLGCSTAEVQADRIGAAKSLVEKYGCTVVLKGAHTLVAAPGGPVLLNDTGNSGMATGGSGDVLTGMVAAYLAMGMDPAAAASCAVYLHGLAGDEAAGRRGQESLVAGDIVEAIPDAYLKIKQIYLERSAVQ